MHGRITVRVVAGAVAWARTVGSGEVSVPVVTEAVAVGDIARLLLLRGSPSLPAFFRLHTGTLHTGTRGVDRRH